MYADYFRLKQPPFSIAPDPAFLYASERHQEALAHLMYGLGTHGGFVLVTGEVGTGKTTLLRSLLDRIPPHVDVAFVLNPRLTVKELLETVCDELGVVCDRQSALTVKQYIDRLNEHLLRSHAKDRSTVLFIDEAQNLSPAVLEQIRLLTNLETNEQKLLRIVLLGQPELRALLARPDLRQLAQRITARYHLEALSREDTRAYVLHRLALVGGHARLFTRRALNAVYRRTRGVPRLINVLCDRAMLGAYVEGRHRVTARTVARAARELDGRGTSARRLVISVVALLLVTVGVSWAFMDGRFNAVKGLVPAARIGASAGSSPGPSETPLPVAALRLDAMPARIEATAETPVEPVPEDTRTAAALPALIEPPAPLGTYDSQRAAFATLFDRWDVEYDGSALPCNHAPTAGLQCLSRRGNWRDVERLQRPVVLELSAPGNTRFYAALVAIDGAGVTLTVGEDTVVTTRSALNRQWFGEYVLLWQMPPHYRGTLRVGDRSPTVTWLREQLARVLERRLPAEFPEVFDRDLENALKEFQRAQALDADGVAGPLTWIRINHATGIDGPGVSS